MLSVMVDKQAAPMLTCPITPLLPANLYTPPTCPPTLSILYACWQVEREASLVSVAECALNEVVVAMWCVL